jgi:hypothetical protein
MYLNVRPEFEKSYPLLDTSTTNSSVAGNGVVAVLNINEYDGMMHTT